jgi:hypothetical protein
MMTKFSWHGAIIVILPLQIMFKMNSLHNWLILPVFERKVNDSTPKQRQKEKEDLRPLLFQSYLND